MEHLDIRETPKLRDPALLMAFAGWNDASSAATTAASFITEKMGGSEFAQIDSDPFYNFQDMRPHVSLDEDSRRKITWPSNTFYACETPNLEHDVVVFLGVEPHLQWGRFSKIILSMVRECRVRMAVTVGALLADVYHRSRVRITGTSRTVTVTGSRLQARIHTAARESGRPVLLSTLFSFTVPAASVAWSPGGAIEPPVPADAPDDARLYSGVIDGPDFSPPLSMASTDSMTRPLWAAAAVWQARHFSCRTGWTSLSKSTGDSPRIWLPAKMARIDPSETATARHFIEHTPPVDI